ncbi:hypothetical protein [Roseofilum sp. Guam]|uniref:hypothetical protein n=1 Tax=Roseofilum sp. Guam TaxID=2821502 RepID=UPI001B1BD55B|nr:hypothetical protein [Roseofilum sp. Guam]MBP0027271.1 hypothetical protein [Roseofilum sp. Guam]
MLSVMELFQLDRSSKAVMFGEYTRLEPVEYVNQRMLSRRGSWDKFLLFDGYVAEKGGVKNRYSLLLGWRFKLKAK